MGNDGGAEGDRTPDLDIANVALSQLSYCPGMAGDYVGGVLLLSSAGARSRCVSHFTARRPFRDIN